MLRRTTGFHVYFLAISIVAGTLSALCFFPSASSAQVLVASPYISSYQDWIDPDTMRGGNWRLSLHNPVVMETSDLAANGNTVATSNNGNYIPTLLIQNNYITPANYDLNVRMYTSDDDGFGLVFGYQNIDNYFRVFFRAQASGSLGGTTGTSIQKVVNGVVTQISPNGTGAGNTLFPTLPTDANSVIKNHTPIDAKVSVTGTTASISVAGVNGGLPLATITDAALQTGRVGVQSWAQRNLITTVPVTNPPHWGTEVESVSVTQGATTLYSGNFNASTNLPVSWRQLVMKNSNGLAMNATGVGEDIGNWGVDINGSYIYQQTNGFEYATATSPHVDFLSPSVVVNSPGATAFTNYEMRTRIGATDNDGLGVLVRVQDDNNFYRINFLNEGIDTGNLRPPSGMSVQKYRNGVWSEVYRETSAPLFIYTPGVGTPDTPGFAMFDLKVGMVGDTMKIQVKDQNNNVYNYPLIQDTSDPILSGSVGLQTWGTDNVYFKGYGGLDTPLLTTLNSLKDVDLNIDRATGNVTIVNNDPTPVNIKGVTVQSGAGSNDPAIWKSIANNYDRASAPTPGDGSVDLDDAWSIVSSTNFNLSESELAGNGGTIPAFGSVNLGNLWRKSKIEDLIADLTLTDNSSVSLDVNFTGTPWGRSDLNADGMVNSSDWLLFYPNMLTSMSGLSALQKALAGDIDGDGDNDVNDFALFKDDYELAHGAGSFNSMLASVPEPASYALFLLGAIGLMVAGGGRRRQKLLAGIGCALPLLVTAGTASANSGANFTTFTLEGFAPLTTQGITPSWTITPHKAIQTSNSDENVLYSAENVYNKRFIGLMTPGTDDDVVGIVLGFKPGDATTQFGSTADYLLLDWKGVTQSFNFFDLPGNFFHDQTPAGNMPVGLALSRVTGLPTADELWQHLDYVVEAPDGGVTELARGATLGSTAYNRTGGSHFFDITYTPTNVTVAIDGVEQINLNGSFPDGRFGLYTAYQGPSAASYQNIEVLPATGWVGLSVTVDQGTGEIKLINSGTATVDFDYYQFNSAAGSLKASAWNSLSDQHFAEVSAAPGQSWDEAGGSNNSVLAEVYLDTHPGLPGGQFVSLGNAFNAALNVHDLTMSYRLLGGLLVPVTVSYIGSPVGVQGDYNGDLKVDAADYVVWRKNPGAFPSDAYDVWRANFGAGSGSGSSLGTTNVPEPASLVLVISIGLLTAVQRRSLVRR